MYDYLIVGSGLFGSVFAREMTDVGKKCLIIDKRKHLGGNIYTEKIENINVHKYGPHIFHTSNTRIWKYVNKFAEFNNFRYEPLANYKNEIYNLPFNMNTFNKMWGTKTPEEARIKIQQQIVENTNPKNIEEFALSQVGKDIYEKLIYGYTCKQWGTEPVNLPTFIIKRLPIRFTYNNNYFNDTYQGIPTGGYTSMMKNIVDKIDLVLDVDFFDNKEYFESISKKIVYTGEIDRFFDYEFDNLEYRSLSFETEVLNVSNFQGAAGVNYTSKEIPYTRIIEHKHFDMLGETDKTIITKEYPKKHTMGENAYYPINDEKNNKKYEKYKNKTKALHKYIFGGRLASYKYYDMHQVIASSLKTVKKEFEK